LDALCDKAAGPACRHGLNWAAGVFVLSTELVRIGWSCGAWCVRIPCHRSLCDA